MLQPMIFHMTFGLETTLGAYFALDSNAYFIDKTGFILISENAEYLQKTLSSKLFEYAYKKYSQVLSLEQMDTNTTSMHS